MIEVFEYVKTNGRCPFAEWFDRLDLQSSSRVAKVLERMEDGNFGDHKSVGSGVLERRLDYGPGYRIYYGRDGDRLVILLGGGTKKHQNKDIQNAQADWQEYKATKKDN